MFGYQNLLGYGPLPMRIKISASGSISIPAPSSGTTLITTAASGQYGVGVIGTAGIAAEMAFAGNGNTFGVTSMDVGQSAAGNGVISNRANSPLSIGTNNTTNLQISATGTITTFAPSSGTALIVNAVSGSTAITTTGDVHVSQQAASTGANLFLEGGPSGATINRVRYNSNAGGNSLFAIRDEANTADRLNIDSAGSFVVHAPTSGVTLTVSQLSGGANAGINTNGYISVSGDLGALPALNLTNTNGADGRCSIQVTDNLTTSQTWEFGLAPGGVTDKSWRIRNTTAGTYPLIVSNSGNVTLATATNGQTLNVNTNATGGSAGLTLTTSVARGGGLDYIAFNDPSGTKGYVGFTSNATDDLTLTTVLASGILLLTNTTLRMTINSAGNVTIAAPDSGTALVVNAAAAGVATQLLNTATNPCTLSICGNNNAVGTTDLLIQQNGNNNAFVKNNANGALTLGANGGNDLVFATTHTASFAGAIGISGNAPPAQVTGFGTPTGTGVIANFPGATATLAQCSQAIAQIIKDLKALGLYAA